MSNTENTQEIAADKSGMEVKTARQYLEASVVAGMPRGRVAGWTVSHYFFSKSSPAIGARLGA